MKSIRSSNSAWKLIGALTLALSCYVPGLSYATSYAYLTTLQLTRAADHIVIADVREYNKENSDLWADITVTKVLKGHGIKENDAFSFLVVPRTRTGPPVVEKKIVWLRSTGGTHRPVHVSDSLRTYTPELISEVLSYLKVLEDPMPLVRSSDLSHQDVLVTWIKEQLCKEDVSFGNRREAVSLGPWESPSCGSILIRPISKATSEMVDYLLAVARAASGTPNRQALSILIDLHFSESLPVFLELLDSSSTEIDRTVLAGLRAFSDSSIIPKLKRHLDHDAASGDEAREICRLVTTGEKTPCSWDDREKNRDEVGRLFSAFATADEVPFLIQELKEGHKEWAAEGLARLQAPAAIPPLLDYMWNHGGSYQHVIRFHSPKVLESARQMIENHGAAPVIVASWGEAADAPFMKQYILQGHMPGLQWAELNRSKEARDTVVQAALTVPESVFAINAILSLAKIPGESPLDFAAAARVFRLSDNPQVALKFFESNLNLGKHDTEPSVERVAAVLNELKVQKKSEMIPQSDLDYLSSWVPFRHDFVNPFAPRFLPLGLTPEPDGTLEPTEFSRDSLRKFLLGSNSKLRDGALQHCIAHDISLDQQELEAISHTETMSLYLKAMAEGEIADDCELLTSRIQQPWAQMDPALYKAIHRGRCTKAITPLRELLSGNEITVREYAAVALGHLGDMSGLAILQQRYQRRHKRGMISMSYDLDGEIELILKKYERRREGFGVIDTHP